MKAAGISLLIALAAACGVAIAWQQQSPLSSEMLDTYVAGNFYTEETPAVPAVLARAYSEGKLLELLNPRAVALFTIALAVAAGAVLVALHLTIDKYFLRKHYESPSLRPALRRGLWLALLIIAWVLLALGNFLSPVLILLSIAFVLFLELALGGLL